MSAKDAVINFYNSSKDKFQTKRQASKYLNGYGTVYKTEHNIPMEYSTRLFQESVPTPKSMKIKKKK